MNRCEDTSASPFSRSHPAPPSPQDGLPITAVMYVAFSPCHILARGLPALPTVEPHADGWRMGRKVCPHRWPSAISAWTMSLTSDESSTSTIACRLPSPLSDVPTTRPFDRSLEIQNRSCHAFVVLILRLIFGADCTRSAWTWAARVLL